MFKNSIGFPHGRDKINPSLSIDPFVQRQISVSDRSIGDQEEKTTGYCQHVNDDTKAFCSMNSLNNGLSPPDSISLDHSINIASDVEYDQSISLAGL